MYSLDVTQLHGRHFMTAKEHIQLLATQNFCLTIFLANMKHYLSRIAWYSVNKITPVTTSNKLYDM